MDFEWIAIALGDVVWISVAFALGLLSRTVGLPPLVGFLATGFLLNAYGIVSGEMLEKLSDLGITLLLFTVGLKLNLRTLAKPQVWAVTSMHMSIVILVFGVAIYLLAIAGAPFFAGLDIYQAAMIAFALSFSSTVYVVKVLEDRGEMTSLHGRIAIGILIVQDIAAVVFMAFSAGEWPSPWALSVLLIFLLQPILHRLLERVGHGELLVLYGLMLALGGAEVFQIVGLKGDLGALVAGLMIASHQKSDEMAKTMLSFKDLFLLGFFLSIGLSGEVTAEIVVLGALIAPLVFLKSALFFFLLTRFNLRSRTSLRASVNLTNYSEFGLIVAAVGVANGWIESSWLIVLATTLSLSFVIAAIVNLFTPQLYSRNRPFWNKFQSDHLIDDDKLHDIGGASIIVIGMGGVGTGTYDTMQSAHGETVVAVDNDPATAENHLKLGRNVLIGDPSDLDFWDRLEVIHSIKLVMLALPNLTANLAVLNQLKTISFDGKIAVIAKFEDEAEVLSDAGAHTVFNVYKEAGAGFAAHAVSADLIIKDLG